MLETEPRLSSTEIKELLREFKETPTSEVRFYSHHVPPIPGYKMTRKIGPKSYDLTGFRCGRLVALRPFSSYRRPSTKQSNGFYWVCKCDCGRFSIVLGNKLTKREATRSCGCLVNESSQENVRTMCAPTYGGVALPRKLPVNAVTVNERFVDLTGTKFGHLTVQKISHFMQYVHQSNRNICQTRQKRIAYWQCKCECGEIIVRDANSLKRASRGGVLSSCGCMRHIGSVKIPKSRGKHGAKKTCVPLHEEAKQAP